MSLFLWVLCGGSLFNDLFCGSHEVNVFKLTVIELLTYLSGLKKLSYYTMFLLLDCYYLTFLLPPPMPCPNPPTPHPELWSSPWEVIYNAIGLTIIRLHTISPCPLCLGRFYGLNFCLASYTLSRCPQRTCKSLLLNWNGMSSNA